MKNRSSVVVIHKCVIDHIRITDQKQILMIDSVIYICDRDHSRSIKKDRDSIKGSKICNKRICQNWIDLKECKLSIREKERRHYFME